MTIENKNYVEKYNKKTLVLFLRIISNIEIHENHIDAIDNVVFYYVSLIKNRLNNYVDNLNKILNKL